jgi:hypothetical protein
VSVLAIGGGPFDPAALGLAGLPAAAEPVRCETAEALAALGDQRYDAIVVLAFDESLPHPAELARACAALLTGGGRIVVDVGRVARPAIRAAVFKGSAGEHVAPLVTDDDVVLYANRSVAALLEEAGLRVDAGAASGAFVEASLPETPDAPDESIANPPVPFAEPTDAERLVHARHELDELRAFFSTIHDNQRRLHEEAARLRAMLGAREVELDALRRETWELRQTTKAATDDGAAAREIVAGELERARERIADLEARNARLREALADFRDRAPAAN